MSYERLAYDDASTPAEMSSDCRAVDLALHLPRQVSRVARSALDTIPEGMVPQAPAPIRHASLAVSDAAAKFAGRLFD